MQEVGLVLSITFQKKKERKKYALFIYWLYIAGVPCHDSLFFFCVCDSSLHFSIARKKNKKWNLTIDRFSLRYVLFSQIRPRDVLQGTCLLSFNKLWIHMHLDARARRTFERNSSLWYHHVIWNEKNIQYQQARKVYSYVLPLILVK